MKRITITLSESMLNMLDKVVDDSLSCENRSQIIRKALLFYLNENYNDLIVDGFSNDFHKK